MKMTRILCPTDFSKASTPAIDLAIRLAGYYKSRISALHVVTPLAQAAAGATTSAEDISEFERLRRVVSDEFDGAAAAGVAVDVLIEMGQPARTILERADSLSADLIVMGTHGTSGFEHFVLGSVTEKVLGKAACPVLAVPPHAQAVRLPFRNLLCAVDFSDTSVEAVRLALALAEESVATLTLMHVIEWPWEEPPSPRLEDLPAAQRAALTEFRRYTEERANARLESLIPDSRPAAQVTTRLRNGKPYVQILEEADQQHCDLIIAGVHGRSRFEAGLFGSTTNQIVRRAKCPVLSLRTFPGDR